MHRASVRNVLEFGGHRRIDAILDADHALEAIDLPGSALGGFTAILAGIDRQLAVPDAHGQAAERELFLLGIDPGVIEVHAPSAAAR